MSLRTTRGQGRTHGRYLSVLSSRGLDEEHHRVLLRCKSCNRYHLRCLSPLSHSGYNPPLHLSSRH
ncbi:hypothetical protein Hanom_Chr12g01070411 [Helianthus anomalus]